MEFGHYTFLIRLEDDALLPPYKGSTFRGLLGHALKRVTCALKRQECRTCILRSNCTYAMVFETVHSVPLPPGARISAPPHPMVLEPPLTEQTEFSKGDTLECGLILFGKINRNLPYFIYAFDQMGKIGLGKKIRGRRSRFVLEAVTTDHGQIYNSESRCICQPENNGNVAYGQNLEPPAEDMEVTFNLLTPLRLIVENRGAPNLPFKLLARSIIRRTTALLNCYGEGEPGLDFRAMVQRAEEVKICSENIRWHDWKRYSNRQERKMFMGGISGTISYRGKIQEFLPMIDMAEKVHLGKNTMFGLGKIEKKIAV